MPESTTPDVESVHEIIEKHLDALAAEVNAAWPAATTDHDTLGKVLGHVALACNDEAQYVGQIAMSFLLLSQEAEVAAVEDASKNAGLN